MSSLELFSPKPFRNNMGFCTTRYPNGTKCPHCDDHVLELFQPFCDSEYSVCENCFGKVKADKADKKIINENV